jgi:hypothetical protein
MIIANPIYDVVFKYLLEDLDIARDLISLILSKPILQIQVQPQERTTTVEVDAQPITVMRLDFVALIVNEFGEHQKVLIELQKVKHDADIYRFRRYLAEHYKTQELLPGTTVKQSLEIITIYFLGFILNEITVPVVRVANCYQNGATLKPLNPVPNENFLRLLTHENYTIQIPRLVGEMKTQLERVLKIFSQEYIIDKNDKRQLDFTEAIEKDNPLVHRMVRRLTAAASSQEIRDNMEFEDEIENTILAPYREAKVRAQVAEQRAIEEKQRADEAEQRANDVQERAEIAERELAELKKKLGL